MSELTKRTNEDGVGSMLQKTILGLMEGVAGLAASDRKERILAAGRIVQSLVSGKLLSQLQNEWDRLRNEGRIKDDYGQTSQCMDCLQEMLAFLDGECPDEKRFDVLKRIFLGAATETASDRASVLPQQYMRLCRSLNSGEVRVLLATYAIAKRGGTEVCRMSSLSKWVEIIATESGLRYAELVLTHERGLIERHLLADRLYRDGSGINPSPDFRLTGLGLDLCRFIETYDPPNATPAPAGGSADADTGT
ncbi:MAG: hypothetical protein A49_31590 [Methyloceanibacter sp.]|nr:MAG: hypothetical protein A49_31590 [Methyloceanibacter sp.]